MFLNVAIMVFIAISVALVAATDTTATNQVPEISLDKIQQIADFYNVNMNQLPDVVKRVMGTETIIAHITFKDGSTAEVGFKTRNGLITNVSMEPYPNSTMILYLSEEALEKIRTSDDKIGAFLDAWGKDIRWEGLTVGTKIKIFLVSAGMDIYSIFKPTSYKEAPPEVLYQENITVSEIEQIEFPSNVVDATNVVTVVVRLPERMNLSVTMSKIKSLPPEIPEPPAEVYSYIELVFTEYATAREVKPTGHVEFRVSKDWMKDRYNPNQIVLMKYGSEWIELPTELIDEDEGYYYFKAEVESFSVFAIAAAKVVEPGEPGEPGEPEVTPGIPGFEALLAAICILIVLKRRFSF